MFKYIYTKVTWTINLSEKTILESNITIYNLK